MSYKDDRLDAMRSELKKLEDFQEIERYSDMVLSIISLSVDLSNVTKQRDEALAALEAVLADNQAGYEHHGLGQDTIDLMRSTISRLKS